jgi:stage V sporulation protein G
VDISDVKVKLMGDRSDRLKAFCSVTIDNEFVIRDLKIIEGTNGMFVAMPSRKITDKCPTCSAKNHLRSKFCNECGARLNESRAGRDADGRTKLHADIAHPINSGCRDRMQKRIIKAFGDEVERSKLPGYKPSYDDEFDETDFAEQEARGSAAYVSAKPAETQGIQQPVARQEDKRSEADSFGAGIV